MQQHGALSSDISAAMRQGRSGAVRGAASATDARRKAARIAAPPRHTSIRIDRLISLRITQSRVPAFLRQMLHAVLGRMVTPMRPLSARGSAMGLDRVIHERLRLGIVSALAAARSLTFGELKELLGTTDGNLSVHARRLEDAGYVRCHKTFQGRMPRTEFRLTPGGRRALKRYFDHMEALIGAARSR
jgi:DNA-binding transcriptional ArsR family regulator